MYCSQIYRRVWRLAEHYIPAETMIYNAGDRDEYDYLLSDWEDITKESDYLLYLEGE
jgi:hypothetical protein